jgi:hypothetical protein
MLQPTPVGRSLVVTVLGIALLAGAGSARADTRILAIGDFGVGGETERRRGAAMERFAAARPIDVLATLGDNDYTESPRAFRRNWTRSFGWAARTGLEIAGTLGNHDVRVRRALLSVKGVGRETCDDILLYAFQRPVFVVDAYTFRIFERLGLVPPGLDYEGLRAAVEGALGPDEAAFNELHALIVAHGKDICRPRPQCGECGLRPMCHWYRALGRTQD